MAQNYLKIASEYGLATLISVAALAALVWVTKVALKNPLTAYSELLKDLESNSANMKALAEDRDKIIKELIAERDELRSQIGNGDESIRAELRAELKAIREDNKELKIQYQNLLLEHAQLQGKFIALEQEMRHKVTLFESSHQSLPIPQWLKDQTGKVLSANAAYGAMILEPLGKSLDDYIGHDDANVYPAEIATEYSINDNQVWMSGQTWIGTETVMTPRGPEQWTIVKYLRRSGPLKLGIGGIAIPPLSNKDVTQYVTGILNNGKAHTD